MISFNQQNKGKRGETVGVYFFYLCAGVRLSILLNSIKSVELVPHMSSLKYAQRRKYLTFRQEICKRHSNDSPLSKNVFKIAISFSKFIYELFQKMLQVFWDTL